MSDNIEHIEMSVKAIPITDESLKEHGFRFLRDVSFFMWINDSGNLSVTYNHDNKRASIYKTGGPFITKDGINHYGDLVNFLRDNDVI